MDAVDIAAVDFSAKRPRILACAGYPIVRTLVTQLKKMQSGPCRITEYAQLDYIIGTLFADCINDFIKHQDLSVDVIAAIGLHGQTILHDTTQSTPHTMQIADPNIVAYKTGITVVSDFRRADIAAGGQGAPLAPAIHALLFAEANKKQVVLNIGGIANATVLNGTHVVAGFDTGPGNCLMDAWSLKHNNKNHDQDGNWAASHALDAKLLDAMLKDYFFIKTPPKSACAGYFSLEWLSGYMPKSTTPSPGAVAATLAELTAITIAEGLRTYVTPGDELLVCGGGVHNKYLIERLRKHSQMTVLSTADKGINPDWVEAILFAWLAKQRLANCSGVIPTVTGANEATVLGAIYHTHTTTR